MAGKTFTTVPPGKPLCKVSGVKNSNRWALLGEEKGLRAVKLKADARTDNEYRRKKNKSKKKDRTQDPTSEAQPFHSNLNSPILFPF